MFVFHISLHYFTKLLYRRKLVSEQTRSCNVQGCPGIFINFKTKRISRIFPFSVDFNWAAWSMWSQCTVSCGQGTKTRTRICTPGLNGGATCPEKKTNMELYEETLDCSQSDCESKQQHYIFLKNCQNILFLRVS